jgi:hypothetical protein
MYDVFYTIVAVWVVLKLLSAFSGRGRTSQTFNQTNNNFYSSQQKKQEGDVVIEQKNSSAPKIPPTEGEYVDYEDLK